MKTKMVRLIPFLPTFCLPKCPNLKLSNSVSPNNNSRLLSHNNNSRLLFSNNNSNPNSRPNSLSSPCNRSNHSSLTSNNSVKLLLAKFNSSVQLLPVKYNNSVLLLPNSSSNFPSRLSFLPNSSKELADHNSVLPNLFNPHLLLDSISCLLSSDNKLINK